jgi:hypothetical protein
VLDDVYCMCISSSEMGVDNGQRIVKSHKSGNYHALLVMNSETRNAALHEMIHLLVVEFTFALQQQKMSLRFGIVKT